MKPISRTSLALIALALCAGEVKSEDSILQVRPSGSQPALAPTPEHPLSEPASIFAGPTFSTAIAQFLEAVKLQEGLEAQIGTSQLQEDAFHQWLEAHLLKLISPTFYGKRPSDLFGGARAIDHLYQPRASLIPSIIGTGLPSLATFMATALYYHHINWTVGILTTLVALGSGIGSTFWVDGRVQKSAALWKTEDLKALDAEFHSIKAEIEQTILGPLSTGVNALMNDLQSLEALPNVWLLDQHDVTTFSMMRETLLELRALFDFALNQMKSLLERRFVLYRESLKHQKPQLPRLTRSMRLKHFKHEMNQIFSIFSQNLDQAYFYLLAAQWMRSTGNDIFSSSRFQDFWQTRSDDFWQRKPIELNPKILCLSALSMLGLDHLKDRKTAP